MKGKRLQKLISLILVMVMIVSMLPSMILNVSADVTTQITDFSDAGFLGRGFNLLGNSPLENSTLSDKGILKSMENVYATVTDTRDTEYLFTYIKDFSTFLQKESASATYSAEVGAKIKIVSLEAKAKYGLQSASSYSEDSKTEYAVLSILRTYEKKYMDLSSTKYIQRIWGQNADGTYITLNDDFVDELQTLGTDDKDIVAFFNRYGTHIITRYVSGGEAILSYSGKDLSSAASSSSSTEFNASAKVDVKAIVNISAEMEQKGAKEENSTSGETDISFTGSVRGGEKTMEPSQIFEMMKGGNTAINDWANSVNGNNSQIIVDDRASNEEDTLQLLPIWELLYRPEDAQMKVAMEEYFNRNVNEQYAQFYEDYIYNPAQDPDYSDYTFITTAEQLSQVRDNLDGKYVLLCNVDLEGQEWTPIGTAETPFTGVFDGNGNTISGLSTTKCTDGAAGLFGYNKGQIRNLCVQGAVHTNETGSLAYIGGIAGFNSGDIVNCKNMVHVSGALTATDSQETLGDKAGLTYDMEAITALLTEANTYDLTTYEGGTINLNGVPVLKLQGKAENPVNLSISTYSATPLYIILENAQFSGDSENGTIYSNCARPVWIISTGEKNSFTNTNNANAVNMADAPLYLVGDGELEISGGKGKDGSGYNTDNSGIDGNSGAEAICAKSLAIDGKRVSLIGGDGGRGADGKAGASSTYHAHAQDEPEPLKAGDGEKGGDGGNGGNGALPIVKGTAITVYNGDFYCYAGRGGDGGHGGAGGDGAYGQGTGEYVKFAAIGGQGGAGGAGGDGGKDGFTRSLAEGETLENAISITVMNDAVAYVLQSDYGCGGDGGRGGDGGDGGHGVPWDGAKAWPTGSQTCDGMNGADGGKAGRGGDAGDGSVAGTVGKAGTPGTGGWRGYVYYTWTEGILWWKEDKYEMIEGSHGDDGAKNSDGTSGQVYSFECKEIAKTASRIYKLYSKITVKPSLTEQKLVSIGSEKEQTLLQEMIDLAGAGSYWIGLTWNAQKLYWEWEDGNHFITPSELDCISSSGKYVYGNSYDAFDEVVFDNWNVGEPNNDGTGETAVQIYGRETDADGKEVFGLWNDMSPASYTSGYITETEIKGVLELNPSEEGIYAGGIVGYNAFEGNITGCINTGKIEINKAFSTDRKTVAAAGGIAGVNEHKITNCYNDGGLVEAAAKSDSLNGEAIAYAYEIAKNFSNGTEVGSVCTGNSCQLQAKSNAQIYTGSTPEDANKEITEQVQSSVDYWKHSALSITRVDRTNYIQGQGFDRDSICVELDGKPIEKYTVWYYFLSTGSRIVKISYEYGNENYQRTIPVWVSAPTVERITISPESNHKTQFFAGDSFTFDGLILTIYLTNGETQSVVAETSNVTFPDLSTAGNQTVAIQYQGLETNYEIVVEPVICESITITELPEKLDYLEGEALTVTGMVVTAVYNNGTERVIRDYEISGYDAAPGQKTVTVSYEGCKTSFTVMVASKAIESIAVTVLPEKTVYKEGEALDLSGMVVTAYYNNGANGAVEDYQISGYDTTPGTKNVIVSYGGYTASLTVTVLPKKLQFIAITKTPDKLTYDEHEALDLTGMEVTAYYDNGTSEVVTGYQVSGYDATVGSKTITVTFQEKVACFEVTVERVIRETDPKIITGSAYGYQGKTIKIPVEIKNNPGLNALILGVTYDETYLTLQSVENCVEEMYMSVGTSVVWDAIQEYTSDGLLCYLIFEVAETAPAGEYEIEMAFISASDGNFYEATLFSIPGKIQVVEFAYGDCNGDGTVTAVDLAMLRKNLANKDPVTGVSSVDVEEGADCNGDGTVTAVDLAMLRKHLANIDPITGESTVVLGPR